VRERKAADKSIRHIAGETGMETTRIIKLLRYIEAAA
jgi:hypothetical protein